MAKTFCIPPKFATQLRTAFGEGKVSIETLYNATSEERNAVFSEYMDGKLATQVNAEFESAMISKQKNALKKWAQKTLIPKQSRIKRKDLIAKIESIDDTGILTPETQEAFLSDLVSTKLGATITADEARIISEKSQKLEELGKSPDTKFGMPSVEYFKARKEMNDYLDSLVPSSKVSIAASTIGRGNMLLSIKSPLLNIIGNTEQGLYQAFERRLGGAQFKGTNAQFAKEYVQHAIKVFNESGYDITRMIDLEDTQKTLGEQTVHSQGEGAVRATGRFFEDVVFKKMLATPDVAYSAVHFADSANLGSTKLAKGNKAKALEIFKDATSLEPKTEEGQLVRSQAIADAMFATYQNQSVYSKAALGVRDVFNKLGGDARLGDQLMPFVKTPANVIGAGLDAGGVGLARGLVNLPKAIRAAGEGDPLPLRTAARDMVRTGIGVTGAFILANMFDSDEFIGEYPTSEKEKQLLELKNATSNSVKIGNKWVSLDYFGPLAAPFVGLMYAKKYGHGGLDTTLDYVRGVGRQSVKIPGFEQLYETVKSARDIVPKEGDDSSKVGEGVANFGLDYIRARVIPGIVYDIAKGTDDVERETKGQGIFAKLKSSIPGLRQSLPERKTTTGESVPTESLSSTLLFGGRVKTANNDPVVQEFTRLSESGHTPTLSDLIENSSRVEDLRQKLNPDRFNKFEDEYYTKYRKATEKTIKSGSYKKAEDEDKKKLLDKAREDVFDETLKKYGWKPKKKK